MSIIERRKRLLQQLSEVEDESVLVTIEEIIRQTQVNEPIELSDKQRAAIAEAIKELDEGKGVPHDEAMKRMDEWLSE